MTQQFVNFFHLDASITKRSDGHSAVEGCAYILRENFVDWRTGKRYDFRRAHQYEYVVASGTVLPDGAPAEWKDPETLWNAAEAYSDNKNAQTARRIEVAFPNQLSDDEVIELTQNIAAYFVSQGMCVTYAIHNNVDKSHQNKHAHFNLTKQPVKNGKFTNAFQKVYSVRNHEHEEVFMTAQEWQDAKARGEIWEKVFKWTDKNGDEVYLTNSEAADEGLTKKDRVSNRPLEEKRNIMNWDTKDTLKMWRADVADLINKELEKAGVKNEIGEQYKVDHRSYKDQGINKIPTRHRGYKVSAIEANEAKKAAEEGRQYQPVTDRAQANMYILWCNYHRKEAEKEKEARKNKLHQHRKQSHRAIDKMFDQVAKRTAREIVNSDNVKQKESDSLHQAIFGN